MIEQALAVVLIYVRPFLDTIKITLYTIITASDAFNPHAKDRLKHVISETNFDTVKDAGVILDPRTGAAGFWPALFQWVWFGACYDIF